MIIKIPIYVSFDVDDLPLLKSGQLDKYEWMTENTAVTTDTKKMIFNMEINKKMGLSTKIDYVCKFSVCDINKLEEFIKIKSLDFKIQEK